jgi:serine/threonine-protein kinase
MFELILDKPIPLSPEERYLCGHYLAYLLSGSRRHGFLMRRPLDPRNADRGRFLLGLTYAILAGATDEAIRESGSLLDNRIEVRPALSPIVVAKYLACRDSPAKRKLFRETRKAIAHVSSYAQHRMMDARGVLNPGLMPQRLDDLNLIAPARAEVDDVLVERWNRVAEVWHQKVEFRTAVLRYATCNAHHDPTSAELWPEVVYPLIERARWHRGMRSRTEAVWDYLSGKLLPFPVAGVALDRAMDRAVPAPLIEQLDESLELMVENPQLGDEADPAAPDETDRLTASLTQSQLSLMELAVEPSQTHKAKRLVRLADPDPRRFSQAQLHEWWKEAILSFQQRASDQSRSRSASQGSIPIGPYRLAVIPSIRGRAAGQIAIQGMPDKQIELSTPAVRTKGSAAKIILSVWVYSDNSLVVVHLDFLNTPRYVLWHAPKSHQLNFDDPADLNHELYTLGLEVPEQLDKALTPWFKPSAKV